MADGKERVMLIRKCDICGAEIRMTIPRYKVIFDGWLYTEEIDICIDCFNRIAEEIKQTDTPQTEREERVMETIPKDEVCRMICKYCIKVNESCQHRWDCPLLTEIAKYKDEPSSSEKPNNCKPQTCENRGCKNYDTINDHCMFIEQCHYEPKDKPQTDCP